MAHRKKRKSRGRDEASPADGDGEGAPGGPGDGLELSAPVEATFPPQRRAALGLAGLALPLAVFLAGAEQDALIGASDPGWLLTRLSLAVAVLVGLLIPRCFRGLVLGSALGVLFLSQLTWPFLGRYLSGSLHSAGRGGLELALFLVQAVPSALGLTCGLIAHFVSSTAWHRPVLGRLRDLCLALAAGLVLLDLVEGLQEETLHLVLLTMTSFAFLLERPGFLRLLTCSLGICIIFYGGPAFFAHSAQFQSVRIRGATVPWLSECRVGLGGRIELYRSTSGQTTVFVDGVEARASAEPLLAAVLFELPHALAPKGQIAVLGATSLLVTRPGKDFAGGWKVVEPDPVLCGMVQTDPEWAGVIARGELHIVNETWLSFLQAHPQTFDHIAIDPPELRASWQATPYTLEFLEVLRRALKPKGFVAVGLPGAGASDAATRDISHTIIGGLMRTFKTTVTAASGSRNLMIVAAGDELTFGAADLPAKLNQMVSVMDWVTPEAHTVARITERAPARGRHELGAVLVEGWHHLRRRFGLEGG